MKKLFMTLVLATLAQFAFGQQQVYVKGYTRSNGTYVQSHYRTSPNNTVYDNWSTYPNVNPYSGQTGTKHYNNYYNNGYNNGGYSYSNYYPSYNYSYYSYPRY